MFYFHSVDYLFPTDWYHLYLLWHFQFISVILRLRATLGWETTNLNKKVCIIFVQVLSATLNGSFNCSCNHLTLFGGGLLVETNSIDFDQVLVEFKNLGETGNVAVILTVALVLLFYIIVLVMVRKADIEDARNVRHEFNLLSPALTRNLKPYRVILGLIREAWA